MSKNLHRNMHAKMDSMKGPEWDSSDDDEEEEEKEKVVAQAKATGNAKGASKSSKKNKDKTNTTTSEEHEMDATVLYIGHLPNEFEERDLKNLLQQFGKVLNIRISRSVKSGNSRGYAFARFQDAETTRIVAETLQGYFVGQRRLICHTVPNPRKSLFYDTDKVIERRKLRIQKVEQERRAQLNNLEKIKEITARLVQRERNMRSKFQKLGIDYDFPGYEACLKAGEEIKIKERKRAGSDDAESGEQKSHDESAKSDKDAKKRKVMVDGATTPPSASKKDTTPLSKQKETKSPLSSKDVTTPASKHNGTKSPLSSKKEGATPADKKNPASATKETVAQNKKGKTPGKSDNDSKPTTNQSLIPSTTRAEQPIKRTHDNVTPTKVATDKLVHSDLKAKKNKKKKKRRESAP